MSINRMDWSRNSNGAVAHPNNQQYLQQSTSSIASTTPSQTAYVPSNFCPPVQNGNFLKGLLGATTAKEILQIQQAALSGRHTSTAPVQQTTQVSSSGQYNTTYSLLQMPSNATNQQSCRNAQNPVLQNVQMQAYPAAFLQSPTVPGVHQQAQSVPGINQQALSVPMVQQQGRLVPMVQQQARSVPMVQQQARSVPMVQQQARSVPMVQQQARSVPMVQQQARSVPMVQQQAQSVPMVQQQAQSVPGVQQQTQSMLYHGANGYNSREVQQPQQGTQSHGYSHNMPSQQMIYSFIANKRSQNTQRNYQPMMPNANSPSSYSVQNGNPNSSVAPYTATNNTNVPVLAPNSQNIQIQTVPLTNTLQSQGGMNDYVQSSQGQMMPNFSSGFANSCSNILPSATGQNPPPPLPPYSQSNTNTPNVYVNQTLSNPNQNGEQNVHQSYTATQDQHTVAVPPPVRGGNVPQDQRQSNMPDILALLKIYQNIKHKYILLNRENNLLRQKMQSALQENSGSSTVKPPLISSLPDKTVPTNNPMGTQEVSQNSAAQNQSPPAHGLQTPSLYDSLNVPVQNITHPSNSFSSYVNPTNNNVDVLSQRNYTGFESGQMNLGTNSSGQAVGSETLPGQDSQRTSMLSTQANNQYLSSGNFNNGNISQNGQQISYVQNFAQTTAASSERCNPIQATNTSNLYGKNILTSSSRDAIKASLPLWKSVPSETEPKHGVNSSHDSLHILEEMAAAVPLTQKSEHSGSITSKGIEPQIAIVPPLVQIKELVNDMNQCPKVISRGENMSNNEVSGLKKNDSFNDILQALKSVDANAAEINLDNIQPVSNRVSSSPCSVEVVSSRNVDQNTTKNIESVDESLQISGICTLVEGNSFYDSSIAMMFEGSAQTQSGSPLLETEAKDHHSTEGFLEDTNIYEVSQEDALSPTTEMMANKPDLQEDFEPSVNLKDDHHETDVYCLEMQPSEDLAASDMFGLESNSVSDQLSELLTEFPFGIKNDMSENKPKSTTVSLQNTTIKNEIPKSTVSFSCDLEKDGSIEESEAKYSMDTSTNEKLLTDYIMGRSTSENSKTEYRVDESTSEESKTEYIMDMSINQESKSVGTSTEKVQPQKTEVKVKSEPTPELPIDEVTFAQQEYDGFEICESPADNIHITLLDQDQMTEIFPEEDITKPVVHGEEAPVDHFEKKLEAPIVDVAASPIKKEPDTKTAPSPEKLLFCCLFSWLTHTNGNAPKCNCKPIEMEASEDSDICENAEELNTDPSAAVIEPTTAGFQLSTDYCKMKSDEIKNDLLPPVNKCPTLETVEVSSKDKSSQEKNKSKFDSSEKHLKENQSQKELNKYDSSANQKILQPRSYLEDHNSKKVKDIFSSSKAKVDDQRKVEKLIIKTDFLKNKHLLKMKRKYKEKTSRVEDGHSRSVQKINTEVGESAKALIIGKIFGSKAKNEKSKSYSSREQSGRSTRKMKSFCSSDKSHTHSQGPVDKRKERIKSRESHFERVKKVPTVQEYLERKRELYNKRSGSNVDQRDESTERHKVVEKSSMESENDSPPKLLRPLSPARTNVKPKKLEFEAIRQALKGHPKSSGAYESLHKKHRGPSDSHGKGSLMKKRPEPKSGSGKEKIYLTPCEGTRRNSYEGISLTKLQIRCSPEKPEYFERRKSLDSYVHNKPSKSETKNEDAPKMLEFKLCPEFVNRSPSTQEKNGEPKAAKEKSVVEGIKSKKEAWCIGIPFKKRKISIGSEDQGHQSPPQSTSSLKPTQKPTHSSRPVQDTQTTFNVFKQLYQEQRSKSLDGSL